MKIGIRTALASLLLLRIPLFAHHSAAAEYVAELTTWHGTITRFTWMNPHTFVYFDAVSPNGEAVHYECEGSSPNGLISNGWTRTSLKPGDKVTIQGWRAKDRTDGCKDRAVILPDGQRLFMGWIGEAESHIRQ